MTVDPQSPAGSYDYQGETYYFCSGHCLARFREKPERFLNRPTEPLKVQHVGIQHAKLQRREQPVAKAPGSDKSTCTCPMHPEVRSEKPGSCPKCGMALEPVTAALPKEKIEYTCPMHPQIVRDAPGSCPICGMALEPRMASLEEEENHELLDMSRRFWLSVV